jgi:hypothetical protein
MTHLPRFPQNIALIAKLALDWISAKNGSKKIILIFILKSMKERNKLKLKLR